MEYEEAADGLFRRCKRLKQHYKLNKKQNKRKGLFRVLGDLSPKFIKVDTSSEKESEFTGRSTTKVAALLDLDFGAGESKSRRERRKDAEKLSSLRKLKIDMLPVNELTWPELVRRHILAYLCMEGNLDSPEVPSREVIMVFRCLQGDGEMVCCSLAGVGGIEADDLLFAEATKQIFGFLKKMIFVQWSILMRLMPLKQSLPRAAMRFQSGRAKVLEPARNLPTNVGTRIRKCVYETLDKGQPKRCNILLVRKCTREMYQGLKATCGG
ncbi:hypothetical protein MKX03_006349 [Papaver bracteatum]|nr:hypothetical protein MKX03_006349 [Papaver bracteatum]